VITFVAAVVAVTLIHAYCAVVAPILFPAELPVVFASVTAASPVKDSVPAMAIST
jgi:hypothetical protein